MSWITERMSLYLTSVAFILLASISQLEVSFAQQNALYVNVNGLPVLVQINYVGPPKILPIATAESYPEGSSINLICTVSGGQRKGLHLDWVIQGHQVDHQSIRSEESLPENLSIGQDGTDISILRISNATHINSGEYSCIAKNPLGEDSTTVKIIINVELRWLKTPKDTEVGLNQDVALECEAVGMPEPKIEWIKHPKTTSDRSNSSSLHASSTSVVVARGTNLKINKAQHRDTGIYECIARNGLEQDLRRIFQVRVREIVIAEFRSITTIRNIKISALLFVMMRLLM